jgi:hypothetical protein
MSDQELIAKIRSIADEYKNETEKWSEYYIQEVIKVLDEYDRRNNK